MGRGFIPERVSGYHFAPVAQSDRALPSEGRGREFDSLRARQLLLRAALAFGEQFRVLLDKLRLFGLALFGPQL